MNVKLKQTGSVRWDAVAVAVGDQAGVVVTSEVRDGVVCHNIDFPRRPDGSGYGGLFVGVPAEVVDVV